MAVAAATEAVAGVAVVVVVWEERAVATLVVNTEVSLAGVAAEAVLAAAEKVGRGRWAQEVEVE